MTKPITQKTVNRVIELLGKGIVGGTVGQRKPGHMCLESAIACATGDVQHSANPNCVYPILANIGINFNDQVKWESNFDRALSLKRYAIAQLGRITLKRKQSNPYDENREIQALIVKKYRVYWKDKNWNNTAMKIYTNEDYPTLYTGMIATSALTPEHRREIFLDLIDLAVEACRELKTEGSIWLDKLEKSKDQEKFLEKAKKKVEEQKLEIGEFLCRYEMNYDIDQNA